MTSSRRRFERPLGQLRYKKLFILAVEGARTERLYFAHFNDNSSLVRVECLEGKHQSAPAQVLKRMKAYISRERLRSSDEAWLVIDKDQWSDEQLETLYRWTQQKSNYHLALSNPRFEYWLLLHFEDGAGVSSVRELTERLRRWLPDYDKGIDMRKIAREQIEEAIRRAKRRDQPPCPDWPRVFGQTTVYRLIERIFASGEKK